MLLRAPPTRGRCLRLGSRYMSCWLIDTLPADGKCERRRRRHTAHATKKPRYSRIDIRWLTRCHSHTILLTYEARTARQRAEMMIASRFPHDFTTLSMMPMPIYATIRSASLTHFMQGWASHSNFSISRWTWLYAALAMAIVLPAAFRYLADAGWFRPDYIYYFRYLRWWLFWLHWSRESYFYFIGSLFRHVCDVVGRPRSSRLPPLYWPCRDSLISRNTTSLRESKWASAWPRSSVRKQAWSVIIYYCWGMRSSRWFREASLLFVSRC